MSYDKSFDKAQEGKENRKTSSLALSHGSFSFSACFGFHFSKFTSRRHSAAMGPASSHKFPVLSSSVPTLRSSLWLHQHPRGPDTFHISEKGEEDRQEEKRGKRVSPHQGRLVNNFSFSKNRSYLRKEHPGRSR